MNNKKGFTIIELVVVIAIIAILAAIVLISVSGYIAKGKDATVIEDMHGLMTDAIANGFNTGYEGICTATGTDPMAPTTADWTAVKTQQPLTGTGAPVCEHSSSGSGYTSFCASVQSLANPAKYWCVDSTGASKLVSSNCAAPVGDAAVTCPSS